MCTIRLSGQFLRRPKSFFLWRQRLGCVEETRPDSHKSYYFPLLRLLIYLHLLLSLNRLSAELTSLFEMGTMRLTCFRGDKHWVMWKGKKPGQNL